MSHLAVIHEIAAGILAGPAATELGHTALAHLVAALPCPRASLLVPDASGTTATVLASFPEGPVRPEAALPDWSAVVALTESESPGGVADDSAPESVPGLPQWMLAQGGRISCIAVSDGEQIRGALLLALEPRGELSARSRELATALADLLALALSPRAMEGAATGPLRAALSTAAIGLEHHKALEASLREAAERFHAAMVGTIRVVSSTVETWDPYTAGHQRRVAELAAAIARELGWTSKQIEGLRMAGLVHDLGKIALPPQILSRPSHLSKAEYELIKAHSEVGYNLLKDIDFPWPLAQVVRQHHERLDGSGYPKGLHGPDILPESKVLAVCDVVESMVSPRPYRQAPGLEAALAEITGHRNDWYDSAVVDTCVRLFREQDFAFT